MKVKKQVNYEAFFGGYCLLQDSPESFWPTEIDFLQIKSTCPKRVKRWLNASGRAENREANILNFIQCDQFG